MKKSIIAAGAASIALAAMPVVSTFAETVPIVDNISVKLDSTCTMTRSGANGQTDATHASAGTWTAGTEAITDPGTYTVASMDAGTAANIGASTFTIVCNDSTKGHSLQVAASGLVGGTTGKYIDYNGSAAAAAGTSSWNITISNVSGFGDGAEGAVKPALGLVGITYADNSHQGSTYLYGENTSSKNTVSNGQFTATYNVGTTTTQEADTYTGSATYTLTYNAD